MCTSTEEEQVGESTSSQSADLTRLTAQYSRRAPRHVNEIDSKGRQGRCRMKAIVVTDKAAGTAGMTLAERPEPNAAENDVVVQVHASGFTPGELTWTGTWTDRLGRDRTPSIPGHELAGGVSSMVTQLAKEAGAYVVGTGRSVDRQTALDFGAQDFVDLQNDSLEDV